ncbi:NADH dehydrogenase [Campylobacterota bacterium]|nr:NADH dehydrogenase [Campylobacterota bacterium]
MTTKLLQIPLGSQHIALLEPLHLKFLTENETVRHVKADLGYVHRGVEEACMTRFTYKQVPTVVSRVCGLCAITHATTACIALEKTLGLAIADRAHYLRMLAVELDRIHSHLLCLAHTAECSGYEALFMKTMMRRETVMGAIEVLTGNRVQCDFSAIGGVNRDMTSGVEATVRAKLGEMKPYADELFEAFASNYTLSLRFAGVGVLSLERVNALGVTGVLARAAGAATDLRAENDDLPYGALGFTPIVEQKGDIHSRNLVRLKEIRQSIELCERILDAMPEGECKVKVRGKPDGEAIARIEAPRGELFYFVKGNATPTLDRLRIRTPTYANLAVFLEIFNGEEFAAVPPILASLDPCMSCTAK